MEDFALVNGDGNSHLSKFCFLEIQQLVHQCLTNYAGCLSLISDFVKNFLQKEIGSFVQADKPFLAALKINPPEELDKIVRITSTTFLKNIANNSSEFLRLLEILHISSKISFASGHAHN